MRQKQKELAKLAGLSKLVQDQDLARLAEAGILVEKVRCQVSDLENELAQFLGRSQAQEFDLFSKYGAHWQEWQREKMLMLNTELANLVAEQESIRGFAQKSFGRTQAVQEIIGKPKAGS